MRTILSPASHFSYRTPAIMFPLISFSYSPFLFHFIHFMLMMATPFSFLFLNCCFHFYYLTALAYSKCLPYSSLIASSACPPSLDCSSMMCTVPASTYASLLVSYTLLLHSYLMLNLVLFCSTTSCRVSTRRLGREPEEGMDSQGVGERCTHYHLHGQG